MVGAGVIGMTCAVRLAEDGHRVEVLARDLPLETTSVVAAALWYPYLALPQDRVTAWAEKSYAAFAALAGRGCGRADVPGTEVLHEPAADPWWVTAVPELTRVPPPTGYADAWSFTSPVIDMPVYLQWLRARLDELGGTVTRISMSALPDSDDVSWSTAPASALGGWPATRMSARCAARWSWWTVSISTIGGWTRPGRRTSCRGSAP